MHGVTIKFSWSYIHIEIPTLAPAWDSVFPTISEE